MTPMLLVALLTEPAALVAWALVALSVVLWRRERRGVASWMSVGLTAFYFLAATPFGANLAVGVMERSAAATPPCHPERRSVIVVLAGGVSGLAEDPTHYERLKEASLRRTIAGVRLARETPESRLVLSGGRGGANREADLMAALAEALGYPRTRLIVERKSNSTFEAALYTVRILKEIGLDVSAFYLVTSALHMGRASAAFRAQGIEVVACPTDFRWVQPRWYEAFIPQLSALHKTSDVWHEVLGYVVYLLTGRV